MTGLLLIGVAIAWIAVAVFIAKWAVRLIKPPIAKGAIAVSIFSVLLVAPLGDEIVGKYQFEALCRKYAVLTIDEQHAMNRSVVSEHPSGDNYAKNTAVRIRVVPFIYRDVETKNVIISFHWLTAEGGWLIRTLGISETNAPLTFNSGCAPEDAFGFKKKFNITVIN